MGELFGCVSAGPASLALRWRQDRQHGHFREEGWGVTVFQGPASLTLKQADSRPDAAMTEVLRGGGLRGDVAIAYIRRWTHSARLANCHPFVRELGGREWAFAHNGRVEGIREDPGLRPQRFHPLGSTDSEYAFCVLLEAIAPRAEADPASHAATLQGISGRVARHGAFNYLLASEGCLHAYSSGEYGLWVAEAPGSPSGADALELSDEDWEITVRPTEGDGGWPVFLAASNPMQPSLPWRRLEAGELVVAVAGSVRQRLDGPPRHR